MSYDDIRFSGWDDDDEPDYQSAFLYVYDAIGICSGCSECANVNYLQYCEYCMDEFEE